MGVLTLVLPFLAISRSCAFTSHLGGGPINHRGSRNGCNSHRGPAPDPDLGRRDFIVGALAVGGVVLLPMGAGGINAPPPSTRDVQVEENAVISIFNAASPSVAFISTFLEGIEMQSRNPIEIPLGTGSGIVWDRDGHIVTNFHVIRNTQAAQITLLGDKGKKGVAMGASLVGYDPDKDVAVLKIEDMSPEARKMLVPITLGSSSDLRVGQTTFAIGNPFGLDHTLTTGVVSGLNREVVSPSGRPIRDVIQTDAAINPGNSGGVLLDSSGKLIGMNTAIVNSGVGFAIPVDSLKRSVAAILEAGGIVPKPALGVSILNSDAASALGVPRGVLILGISKESAAAKAGLRSTKRSAGGAVELGDVIVAIDGIDITNSHDLFAAMETKAVGQTVEVTVLRTDVKTNSAAGSSFLDGSEEVKRYKVKVKIVLTARPETAGLSTGVRRTGGSGGSDINGAEPRSRL